MTFDAIALCRDMPGPEVVLAALLEAGRGLRVDVDERTGVTVLWSDDGRRVLRIEDARLVQVPGEARRLLGITAPVPHPAWWVETCSPSSDSDAAAVARRFVGALASLTGGCSWSIR